MMQEALDEDQQQYGLDQKDITGDQALKETWNLKHYLGDFKAEEEPVQRQLVETELPELPQSRMMSDSNKESEVRTTTRGGLSLRDTAGLEAFKANLQEIDQQSREEEEGEPDKLGGTWNLGHYT